MYPRSLSWIELKEYIESGRGPLVLPIGSVEAHGVHLPIDTDTLIATFLADKLAERNNWVSLPPITYTIAVPVRPGNVHIPPEIFRDYLKAVLEHFISFGQRMFIIVMGHGGPDMKKSVVNACNYLCRKYDATITVFHISQILKDLHLVDTSIDKHAGMWETSIIMAIDSNLVKNLDLYRKCRDPRRYGVAGDPLKASPNQGLKLIEAVVGYIEDFIRNPAYSKCYYNWLK
ncbi:creatininase family protein [Desulfurococcaceae archaeon MEX13E-LK6-19]|nr:creatininase family protein [Desulfurococcaceae archaeon MEX13E-LK6-19]